MRKALVVGVDYYEHLTQLHGCAHDANSVERVIERNSDGSVNFTVKRLVATSPRDMVSRADLLDAVRALFASEDDTALLYFAGHGYFDATGGYLLASDSRTGDDGVPLGDIVTLASRNPSGLPRILVLDSCHSGIAAARPMAPNHSELSEGLTILAASTDRGYALEDGGGGVFTHLFVDALQGAASDLVGQVSPGSVYAHIDQSLGPWEQRPVFKANVKNFVSLRRVEPPICLHDLQRLSELFPVAGFEFDLDPSYEPTSKRPNKENVLKFALLQKYNRVNLVVPVEAPHMYDAAMKRKSCKLTALGEHYRRLAEKKRI